MDVKKSRKLLGKAGKDLSDEEVVDCENRMRMLADLIIDRFLEMTPEERAKFAKKKVKK